VNVSIPSAALGRMAQELAEMRVPGCTYTTNPEVHSREHAKLHIDPLCSEYYRIIDRIARGEKP
jgi:hypothetical protein